MHSFPANRSAIAANVEAAVAEHGKAIADAETRIKAAFEALEAKLAAVVLVQAQHAEALIKYDAAIAANEARVIEQDTKSVLRRVLRWLTTYEGIF